MSIADKLTRVAENVPRVYEAGKDAGRETEYNAFWDAFQENGDRYNYQSGFAGYGWNAENFKPKYDIVPLRCDNIFASTINLNRLDLALTLQELGVAFDTSKCTNLTYAFYYSKIARVGEINATSASSLSYIFSNSTGIKTVDRLILKEDGTQLFTNSFAKCAALENIEIEGVIGNDISFVDSPKLSASSIESIVSHLSDTAEGKTLTLSAEAVANIPDQEVSLHPYRFNDDDFLVFTDNGDGSITVNCDNPDVAHYLDIYNSHELPAGRYAVSLTEEGAGFYSTMSVTVLDENYEQVDFFGVANGESVSVMLKEGYTISFGMDLMGEYSDFKITPTLKKLTWESLKESRSNWEFGEV